MKNFFVSIIGLSLNLNDDTYKIKSIPEQKEKLTKIYSRNKNVLTRINIKLFFIKEKSKNNLAFKNNKMQYILYIFLSSICNYL